MNINKENIKQVASRDEIEEGDATILCTVDNNKTKEYKVKIKKIYLNNYSDNKSMLIEVVDEELLEKTGGIIRGLSGAPILQNNKVIGAVTHVFVASPNLGYGVFADMMIKNMNEL